MIKPKSLSQKILLMITSVILCGGLGFIFIAIVLFSIGNGQLAFERYDIFNKLSSANLKLILAINHVTSFVISSLVLNFYVKREDNSSFIEFGEKINIKLVLKCSLFFICCYPLAGMISYFIGILDLPSYMESMSDKNLSAISKLGKSDTFLGVMTSILVMAIIPGVGEELLFRGIFQKILCEHINPFLAIAVSSFIFAALHLDPEGIGAKWVIGASLGLIYYFTKNIWVPIIIHVMNNATILILLNLSNNDQSAKEDVGFQGAIAGLVFIPMVIFFIKNLKQYSNG
jgi:uncharacterized protein